MRYTWQQIQQMYPDQWVTLKDLEDINGNLISAVVMCSGKNRADIYRYEDENPEKFQTLSVIAYRYTGEIIEGIEYNVEDEYTIMELSNAI